jgi:Protein of unknown function (DUF4058)
MPSPFPGMNPYLELEGSWHDFHLEFLPAIRERLVTQVRPKYIVLLDEHVYVQEMPSEPRRLVGRADVSLAATSKPRAKATAGVGILEAKILHHVYDVAGYVYFIYAGRTSPQLSAKDATWARALLPPKS